MLTNSTENRTLRITNDGERESARTARLQRSRRASQGERRRRRRMPIGPSLDLGKERDATGVRNAGARKAAAGPDAFGYRWKDSDAAGRPRRSAGWTSAASARVNFNARHAATTRNARPTCRSGSASRSTARLAQHRAGVHERLAVVHEQRRRRTGRTRSLPTSSSYPENLVAPFWDDLDLRTSGRRRTPT